MVIYHIVPEQEFRTALDGPVFVPAALARDGFVHCSFEASVIAVANDYFAEVPGRLLLLELAPEKLSPETRHESPAPLLTGGSAHLDQAALFPHVYGPIDRVAITRVGVLRRTAAGFEWPTSFISLDSFLAADPPAQPPTSL